MDKSGKFDKYLHWKTKTTTILKQKINSRMTTILKQKKYLPNCFSKVWFLGVFSDQSIE